MAFTKTHRIKGRHKPHVDVSDYTRQKAIEVFCTECMGFDKNPRDPVRPASAEKWQEQAEAEGIPIPTGYKKNGDELSDEGCVSFTCPLFPYRKWSKAANER